MGKEGKYDLQLAHPPQSSDSDLPCEADQIIIDKEEVDLIKEFLPPDSNPRPLHLLHWTCNALLQVSCHCVSL